MSFLKNLFSKEDQAIRSHEDFWAWFQKNEKSFYNVVRMKGNFERDFFDIVSPKLLQLRDGLFLLSGMFDDNTAELIITPDGNINNIVFAEELVGSAPHIEGWRFTALKPESGEGFDIRKGSVFVSEDNLEFFADEVWERPDEISISIFHSDINEENRDEFAGAILLFLDNYLGELSFATRIDNISVVGEGEVNGKLFPINELKTYLLMRESKFAEKYDGSRMNTDEDAFTMMEAELESGNPLIAVINTTLLKWDRKPSHPWIAGIQFVYGDEGNLGMPGEETYKLLSEIEDDILSELKDSEGHLNVGRETANNERTVYFACKDFRKPSKVFERINKKHADRFQIESDIYKDKYWQTFDRFLPLENNEHVN
jgi:Family of unknown function (DUF695).